MIHHQQKGVSLIISFMIMTIMLSMVLGFSTILFKKIKILGNIGDSLSSFYAAESGIEKTLYFDRKQGGQGGGQGGGKGGGRGGGKGGGRGGGQGNQRGICNICNTCADCDNCTVTPTSPNGCNPNTCNNCQISYNSVFTGRNYDINVTVTPSEFFTCSSVGQYKNSTRIINVTSASISAVPNEQ